MQITKSWTIWKQILGTNDAVDGEQFEVKQFVCNWIDVQLRKFVFQDIIKFAER